MTDTRRVTLGVVIEIDSAGQVSIQPVGMDASDALAVLQQTVKQILQPEPGEARSIQ